MPTTRVPPADGSLPGPGVVALPSRTARRALATRGRPARLGWPMLAALLLAALALPLPGASPAAAARASSLRTGDAGWAARPIEAGGARHVTGPCWPGCQPATMLAYHPETGRVRMLSGTPGRPLTDAPVSIAAGEQRLGMTDARARARRFVERYGSLFGLASPMRELRAGRVHRHLTLAPAARRLAAASGTAGNGASVAPSNLSVRFDQVRDGVPVMGGQIVVQVSGRTARSLGGRRGAALRRERARRRAALGVAGERQRRRPGWLARDRPAGLHREHPLGGARALTTRASWTIPAPARAVPASSGASMPACRDVGRTPHGPPARRRGCAARPRAVRHRPRLGRGATGSSATTGQHPRPQLPLRPTVRPQRRASPGQRRRRRGRRLPADGRSTTTSLPAASGATAWTARRPPEGHRALLRGLRLPLAQRRVEVVRASRPSSGRAGRRRTTSWPTS